MDEVRGDLGGEDVTEAGRTVTRGHDDGAQADRGVGVVKTQRDHLNNSQSQEYFHFSIYISDILKTVGTRVRIFALVGYPVSSLLIVDVSKTKCQENSKQYHQSQRHVVTAERLARNNNLHDFYFLLYTFKYTVLYCYHIEER